MPKVVIAGAGWSGCAAAMAVVQAGGEAVLVERCDTLLGTGYVGGLMRNNGRYTAAEEMIAMGGGELFKLIDKTTRHTGVEFPGHHHGSLYDVALIEPRVRTLLQENGIELWVRSRVTDVKREDGELAAIVLENGQVLEGDAFVDTTGTAGGQPNCRKYGNGCSMCMLRCPTFGNRVSISAKAGVMEKMCLRPDGGFGAFSGACKLHRGSVDAALLKELDRTGAAVVPLPKSLIEHEKKILPLKCCQQYNLPEFEENLILLETGHVKALVPYMPIEELRLIPGLQNARYEDPYAGGVGNSIRFLALAPRDDTMQVEGPVNNLFCGGEKAGPIVGHTEAICTGTLGGHNAVRHALGKALLTLPRSTAVGEMFAWSGEKLKTEEGLRLKYTFAGSVYFARMQELGTYTTDTPTVQKRIADAGMTDVFKQRVS